MMRSQTLSLESAAKKASGWQRSVKKLVQRKAWRYVRGCIVLLLLLTCVAKVLGVDDLMSVDGLLGTPEMIGVAIGVELFAIVLLVIAPAWLAYRVAAIVFTLFSVIATTAWLTNRDCNCFGSHTVSGIPLLVDLTCLVLLFIARESVAVSVDRQKKTESSSCGKSIGIATSVAIIGFAASWRYAAHAAERPQMPSKFGVNLIGHRFPLLTDKNVAEYVAPQRETLFVLLRADCEHCSEFSSRWHESPPMISPTISIVGISLSTTEWTLRPGTIADTVRDESDHLIIHWDDIGEPFVQSPMCIALVGEIVIQVVSGEDALELLDKEDEIFSLFDPH